MEKQKSAKELGEIDRLQDALCIAGLKDIRVVSVDPQRKHVHVAGGYADVLLARRELAGWKVDRSV